jgi:hypothetical protein
MNYIDKTQFDFYDIDIKWINYSNYHIYPQFYGKFIHEVSILDLLFNCGPNSYKLMKYLK